jgi:major type 1 subunit fimbrin (pilin)
LHQPKDVVFICFTAEQASLFKMNSNKGINDHVQENHTGFITASLFISTSALAMSNNTITFRGEVSDETCSVAINGNQAKPVVILPTVSAKELAKGGDTAGQVTFDIGLTGCTGNADKPTKISTVFVGNQVTSNGNLGNTGDAPTLKSRFSIRLRKLSI